MQGVINQTYSKWARVQSTAQLPMLPNDRDHEYWPSSATSIHDSGH